MSTVRQLHEAAMEAYDHWRQVRHSVDCADIQEHLKLALELERKAAYSVPESFKAEPTRSVLFRSAASIALEIGDDREAERLACVGLSGGAPEYIADELRDLIEQISFHRHLRLRGIELHQNEFQLSINGGAVGYGFIESKILLPRLTSTEKLIQRFAERHADLPFRGAGRPSSTISEAVDIYYSIPRAASFAMTYRVGKKTDFLISAEGIIHEMLDCFRLLNEGKENEISERIPDESYYKNFISLATIIAPDGRDVAQVGLTSLHDGKLEEVGFVRRRDEIQPRKSRRQPEEPLPEPPNEIHLRGRLKVADASAEGEERVAIVDEDTGVPTVFRVQSGLRDMVRQFFDDIVEVEGQGQAGQYTLVTMWPAD